MVSKHPALKHAQLVEISKVPKVSLSHCSPLETGYRGQGVTWPVAWWGCHRWGKPSHRLPNGYGGPCSSSMQTCALGWSKDLLWPVTKEARPLSCPRPEWRSSWTSGKVLSPFCGPEGIFPGPKNGAETSPNCFQSAQAADIMGGAPTPVNGMHTESRHLGREETHIPDTLPFCSSCLLS